MRCPACEYENEEMAFRCTQCGTRLRPIELKTDPIGLALLAVFGGLFTLFVLLEACTEGQFGWAVAGSLVGMVFAAVLTVKSLAATALLVCVPLLLFFWVGMPRDRFPIRARVAMVQAEQRNIAVALESYRQLEGRLPTQREYCDATHLHDAIPETDPPIEKTLTSPVSHIAAVPGDPFRDRQYHYGYWTDGALWILRSYGPDKMQTADLKVLGEYLAACGPKSETAFSSPQWQEGYIHWIYDPTNGITSRGDIIKTGP